MPTQRATHSASIRNDLFNGRIAGALGLAAVMAAGLLLSGCNTTAGAGQDVKATGAAITRGANDVKNGL